MRDDPTVVPLVLRARAGDQAAWNEIVRRYATLVWSLCRGYGLVSAEAQDVGQTVWLRLVERLAVIRQPAALPDWLASTTRRECLRLLRAKQSGATGVGAAEVGPATPAAEEPLLIAERDAAIRSAFADLPPCCRQLLSLLAHDPPLTDAEISVSLGMPAEGLGPRRARCLERLRAACG
jgi:RNA polymerase sigma factor (sigma-70 family)